MGYNTDFRGGFELNKPLSDKMRAFLVGLNTTRRMQRDGLDEKYGVQGEFYMYSGTGMGMGTITGVNEPPSTQPGLWCGWAPLENTEIAWDGGEKFYKYVEWLVYLIHKVLAPNGYVLNGAVEWRGDEWDDTGTMFVFDNSLSVIYGAGTAGLSFPPHLRQPTYDGIREDITLNIETWD